MYQLPADFIHERFILSPKEQPAFVRQASPFEDIVVYVLWSKDTASAPIALHLICLYLIGKRLTPRSCHEGVV